MATNSPPESPTEDKPASKKPKDTKFKQQKLPAWQPILTANTVLPAFFAIGIAFIPLGVALLVTSDNIKEYVLDYTNCYNSNMPNQTCSDFLKDPNTTTYHMTCTCKATVTLDEFQGSVYMYYGLTNFYQNHRRYVRSRDDNQLNGQAIAPGSLNQDCDPYRLFNSTGIAPCGAIANSLFNDSFTLTYKANSTTTENVDLLKTGIAWVSDKNVKFNNPTSWDGFSKPPNWPKPVWELDTDQSDNGYENEDLIVWMRTAALPTFRKLYRRIDHKGTFSGGLPAGDYEISITYAYPVEAFAKMADVMYVAARDVFCILLLFVTVSVCKDRRQAVPPGNGHCVMYGICGVNPVTGMSVFCAYTGPPKPLTDPTARSVLDEWCPDFAHDTGTCCDALQLRWLQSKMTVPDQLLGSCPACNHNFRNIFCNMVCSPKQSDFIAVTSTTSGHSVTAIKYDVSTTFADGMYNSCKEVRLPSSGERAISVLCGRPSDKCSPKRLLDYIGNTNTGQIPFSTQFNVTDNPDTIPSGVTLYPMNATAIPCSSPFGNRSKCSCRDCEAVPCPTTTQAPVPAYPCTNGPSDVIREVSGYASLHLVIQRLGNHSEVKHYYPPPSPKSIMFQSVFEKEFLHQVLDLQTKIQTLNFTKGSTRVSLEDICLHGQVAKHCTVRSVLQYFQDSNHNVDKKVMDPSGFFVMADFLDHLLTCFRHPETVLDPPLNISCVPDYGGVVKPSQIFCGYDGSNYQNSTALVMTFVVKNPRVSAAAAVWTEGLRSFIKTWQDAHSDVKITFFEPPK